MRSWQSATSIILLALGSTAAVFYLYQYDSQSSHTASSAGDQETFEQPDLTGQVLPDFSLPDINGKVRNVREWDGQVIALNFWATWCAPCLQEIPEFVALQNKYAKQGLQFVGIALQNADEITDFVQSQKINYPVLVGHMDVVKLAESLGDNMGILPYTVIIDRNKKIYFIKNGRLHGDKAEQVIKSLL